MRAQGCHLLGLFTDVLCHGISEAHTRRAGWERSPRGAKL
jgi:hypothetical protein